MGQMINRRRVMGGELYTKEGYIKKGLIFHLDGLNDGGIGGHWIDIVQKSDFTLENITKDGDGFVFEGDSTATDSIPAVPGGAPSLCTVEFVFKTVGDIPNTLSKSSEILGTTQSSYGPWIRFYSTYSGTEGQRVEFLTGKNSFRMIRLRGRTLQEIWPASMTLSISEVGGFLNGVEKELSNDTAGYGPNSRYILRGIQNMSLKFCSIRIYSRPLPRDEVIYNQQVDNQRFNLGLSI